MKVLLSLAVALTALCFSQKSQAQALSNDVSYNNYSSMRQFNTTRTDTTVGNGAGCGPASNNAQSCPGMSCNKMFYYGNYTNGVACCNYVYICREDGTVDPQLEAQAIEQASLEDSVASAFDDSRTDNYWGYVNATQNRSPNLGRAVSIDARLDACMGNTAVDAIVASSSDQYSQWQTCTGSNYCGNTLVNGYCSANSNQVCLDRCNCKYQAYLATIGISVTCNNY